MNQSIFGFRRLIVPNISVIILDEIGNSGFCEQDVDRRELFEHLIVVRNTLFVGSVSSSRETLYGMIYWKVGISHVYATLSSLCGT